MRIINKKYLLIILLIVVILTGVVIFKPKEEVKLDNVILKQEVNNKTFAMYKEEGNEYVPVEDNKFPDMYVLNLTKSKCIDNNGNELEGVLSYENDKVTITSGNTTYCYLYFDKSLGLEIKEKNPQGLSTDEIRGEMYRFQGQAKDENNTELVNNYICFGTSNKEKCVKAPDHHMYRIIGIEAETGRVKVIKKEALKETESETYQWWDKDNEDITFPNSKIYEAIKGSDFLENTDYVPTGWEEKIATNTWTYGDMYSNSAVGARQTGEGLFETETGKKETQWCNWADKDTPDAIPTTVGYEDSPYKDRVVYYTNESGYWTKTFESKVSLMYLHDYYYSVSDDANCEYDERKYEICQTGWIHLSQNDANAQNSNEWTMVRYGWRPNTGYYEGDDVHETGATGNLALNSNLSVRPVFYINASEELLSGNGTSEDPFMIKQ